MSSTTPASSLGPELVSNQNGDTADTSPWGATNATLTSGSGFDVSTTGAFGGMYQNLILEAGKTYRVTLNVISVDPGCDLRFFSNASINGGGGGGLALITPDPIEGAGFYTTDVAVPAEKQSVKVIANQSGCNFVVDQISIREVL